MNQTVQTSTRVQNLGSFVWSIAEIDDVPLDVEKREAGVAD
jgi:hypothetical protein